MILQREGYIRGFSKGIVQDKKCFLVFLKYTEFQSPIIKKIVRVSKPGKRIFSKAKHL
jgi:small subunit ribosomal protein S8